jgi:hypothetical protein
MQLKSGRQREQEQDATPLEAATNQCSEDRDGEH